MNITSHSSHELRERIERLVSPYASVPQAFTRAVESILAAKAYQDPVLVRSAIVEALEALNEAVNEATERRLGLPAMARKMWLEVSEILAGHPFEPNDELDAIGRDLDASLGNTIKALVELRDGPVKLLQQNGYTVTHADELVAEISELEDLKRAIAANWPWSDRELPPLDEDMLNRSLKAIREGRRGDQIEDVIRRANRLNE